MPAPANLVHQLTSTTGLGNITLSGVNGSQTFVSAFGTGVVVDVFDYYISSQTQVEWERGTGHLSSATILVRDTVIESSNSNSPVNFSSGLKDVTNDVPAGKQVYGALGGVDNVVPRSNLTGNELQSSLLVIDDAGVASGIKYSNTGLKSLDTDASNTLTWKPGSNLTADRTFTFAGGDADRTLTMTGNATLLGSNLGDQTAATLNYLNTSTGGVTRTTASRLQEVFSVKDFGAAGNGVTDDSAAINLAITAANAAGGGVVYIPPGVYITGLTAGSITISMLSNVHLQGAGMFATTLKIPNSTIGHGVNTIGQSNYMISDICFDGNKANQGGLSNAHNIRNNTSTNFYVYRCQGKNSTQYGITTDGCANFTIGFNYVKDSDADGIDTHNTGLINVGGKIIGNLVDGFGSPVMGPKGGIHVRGRGMICSNNTVINGAAFNGLNGIITGNGENVNGQIISNNYVEMGAGAVNAQGIGSDNPGAVVTGNTVICTSTTLDGLVVSTGPAIVIGNFVTGPCTRDSIRISADDCTVTGNTAVGAGQDGFEIDGNRTLLSNNKSVTCTAAGFRIVGDSCMLSNNDDNGSGSDFIVTGALTRTALYDAISANLTKGYTTTSFNNGTKSSGTFTPTATNGNIQHYINGGAHTLAPPTLACTIVLECTNATAGALTTSGFSIVSGDAYSTTGTKKFIFYITKTNSFSELNIRYITGT